MSLDIQELETESAELLPGREALGRLKFGITRTTDITQHVAHVSADNHSVALNLASRGATAASASAQAICITQ